MELGIARKTTRSIPLCRMGSEDEGRVPGAAEKEKEQVVQV